MKKKLDYEGLQRARYREMDKKALKAPIKRTKAKVLHIRCSELEHIAFKEASEAENRALSDWARLSLLKLIQGGSDE